jgi:hypothetical protein
MNVEPGKLPMAITNGYLKRATVLITKRFIVTADEKRTAFLELESAVRAAKT